MTRQEMNEKLAKFVSEEEKDGTSMKELRKIYDYEMEKVKKFADEFDDTGTMTLLYLAKIAQEQIEDTWISLKAMRENPKLIEGYEEYLKIIGSEEVRRSREDAVKSIAKIVAALSTKVMIGGVEAIEKEFDTAIETVVEGMGKLKFEVYLNSGREIEEIRNFSQTVEVANSLAEMLLRIERSKDGIHVGFIENPGTLDGWFGIFCKSNGNIFSYNERIDEEYIGQHRHMRNGRYAEKKAYDLFPYELCEFSEERDYKGYSVESRIGEKRKLLEAANYSALIRTILSMAMIARRHTGKKIEGNSVIVNSLIGANLAKLKNEEKLTTAIVKWEGSQLIKIGTEYNTPRFEVAKVLKGDYDKEFNHSEGREVSGWFEGVNQEMVDAYGAGFEISQDRILESNSSRRLIGDTNTDQEFIGTEERMRLAAYYDVRRQLAHYIRKQMQSDYDKFGGEKGMTKWYREELKKRMEKILRYCADAYRRKRPETNNVEYGEDEKQEVGIFSAENGRMRIYIGTREMLGPKMLTREKGEMEARCPITRARANVFFRFEFKTYKQVESILGLRLPKFCVGWREMDLYNGNYILDVTDPVGNMRNVLKYDNFDFDFGVGLSKSGLKKIERNCDAVTQRTEIESEAGNV